MTLAETIAQHKSRLGSRLCILAHHYQSDSVVRHADILGDSLELARRIDGLKAEHIVFCGVHFMAETAAILARPEQKVHIPDSDASCVMAEMAPAPLVETVITALNQGGRRIIPLTYVNSSAAVKAVCGRFGGSVCTSANAATMLRWALDQGDGVLFLPDANLGMNTARLLGLKDNETRRIDVRGAGSLVTPAGPGQRLFLWPGLCAIHAKFHADQVGKLRSGHPGALVLVHPECGPEVVEAADGSGSTSYLIKAVAEAPAGTTIFVGTEWNLVNRLKIRHPDKTVRPMRKVLCSNMAKITETNLLNMLEKLETAPPVRVDEHIARPARLALERMLAACR
jgi:quinolinate synthase